MSEKQRRQIDKYLGKEMDKVRDQAQKLAGDIHQATLGAQARFADPEARPDELTVIVERREDKDDAGSIRILLAIGGVRVRFQVESNGLGLMRTYAAVQTALQSSSITRHIGVRWIDGELLDKTRAEQVLVELRELGSNELDAAVFDLVEAILRGDESVVSGLATLIQGEVAAFGQSKARPADLARIAELGEQLATQKAGYERRIAELSGAARQAAETTSAQLALFEAEKARVLKESEATVNEVTLEKQESLKLAGTLEEKRKKALGEVAERTAERDQVAAERDGLAAELKQLRRDHAKLEAKLAKGQAKPRGRRVAAPPTLGSALVLIQGAIAERRVAERVLADHLAAETLVLLQAPAKLRRGQPTQLTEAVARYLELRDEEEGLRTALRGEPSAAEIAILGQEIARIETALETDPALVTAGALFDRVDSIQGLLGDLAEREAAWPKVLGLLASLAEAP